MGLFIVPFQSRSFGSDTEKIIHEPSVPLCRQELRVQAEYNCHNSV